ncbi:MAG: DUF3786 domain-containing protein [Nitrospirae bacterium]|nr:DUF3786 domain-containing protein [Nitrospirota bacterium]
MAETNNPGEDKAWEILTTLKPADVCKAASVSYDAVSLNYQVTSFGMDFIVSVRDRKISSTAPGSEVLLGKLGYFFRLSVLWYLVSAKDITCTNRPVKLEHIRGGDIFTRGSHVLPLDSVAKKYGKDREGFIDKGRNLGGEVMTYGDVSLRLAPLPRIPVTLTLWLEDDEFPARLDLLFDSTCEMQLSTDVIWSIAMMSVLIML